MSIPWRVAWSFSSLPDHDNPRVLGLMVSAPCLAPSSGIFGFNLPVISFKLKLKASAAALESKNSGGRVEVEVEGVEWG